MGRFASGKYAKAISDRSGLEFPYTEMVREWNGSFVHISEYEEKQPQLQPRAKWGGATGNYNVHQLVFKKNWVTMSRKFLKSI